VTDSCRAKARTRLQRLFSTFPGGRPGLGLLLLRIVSGAVALLQGGDMAFGSDAAGPLGWMLGLLVAASGAALFVGLFTPVASAVVAIVCATPALLPQTLTPIALPLDRLALTLTLTIAVAMTCLGPGAFSLDAWLFGRREVLIRR
jgi:uncharacterized membrane protein YphA (DoxX/SURF4 family)